MYQPYADAAYYKDVYGGDTIPEEDIEKCLRTASRHVDSLTYNRIVGRGFENLTSFQQDLIQEVCCEMADFEHENADMIQSVLQNYAINGVTMVFGSSWNLRTISGVAVRADTYDKLEQTGLCQAALRGRW